MAGIDVLASFGIGAAELDAYGQVDSGEAGPPSGSGIPRARRVARSGARQGPRGQILPPPSPGRGLGSCIDAPGLGKLGNSLPEGFNDEAKTPKKAVAAYPTSSASGSGHSSSPTKTTPGNEGDSKNKQAPGKV